MAWPDVAPPERWPLLYVKLFDELSAKESCALQPARCRFGLNGLVDDIAALLETLNVPELATVW